MKSEPVRMILHSVSIALGVVTFLALTFGLGVEQSDPAAAAAAAVVVIGVISGASEQARSRVTPVDDST